MDRIMVGLQSCLPLPLVDKVVCLQNRHYMHVRAFPIVFVVHQIKILLHGMAVRSLSRLRIVIVM